MERFSRYLHTKDQTISVTTGTDLQIPKAALPYPSTLSSIKVYYGPRNRVARFLTSKAFTIPASPTKAGSGSLISSDLLAGTRFSIPDVILDLDFHGNRKESYSGIV